MRPQPSKARGQREAAIRRRQEDQAVRDIYLEDHPDAESPESVRDRIAKIGQAAGRIFQGAWRKRKPIVRGGAVIGYQKPGNTA